jgi:hypothetical protein
MGKLQTNKKCYELERQYDFMAESLPDLPAVSGHPVPMLGRNLSWR